MNTRQALKIVVESVHRITDSDGSPSDQAQVVAFRHAPITAPIDVFFYVGGIPVRNFFAFSMQAFDNSKNSLWQEIQARSRIEDLPQPSNWDSDTRLLQLAAYVQAFANQQEG